MEKIIAALKDFYTIVEGYNQSHPEKIFWILSGSVSLVVQGVDIVPSEDIDILTDEIGAQKLDELLSGYVIKQSAYSSTEKYQSFFGIYHIHGIQIEVMGNFQYLQKDGSRSEMNHTHEVIYKEYAGMHLPMLTLEQELQEYEHMGKTEKVGKIKEKLDLTMK